MKNQTDKQKIDNILKELEKPNITNKEIIKILTKAYYLPNDNRFIQKLVTYLDNPELKLYAKIHLEEQNAFDKIPPSNMIFPGFLSNEDIKRVLSYISKDTLSNLALLWNYQEKDKILENIDKPHDYLYTLKGDSLKYNVKETLEELKIYSNYLNELIQLLLKTGEISINKKVKFSNPQNSIYIKKHTRKFYYKPINRKTDTKLLNELKELPSYHYDPKQYYQYLSEIPFFIRLDGIYNLENLIEHIPNKLIQAGVFLLVTEHEKDKILSILESIKNQYITEYKKYLDLMNDMAKLIQDIDRRDIDLVKSNHILENYNKPTRLNKSDEMNISNYKKLKEKFFHNKIECMAEIIIEKFDSIVKQKINYEDHETWMTIRDLRFYKCNKSIQKLVSLIKNANYIQKYYIYYALEWMQEFDKVPFFKDSILENINDNDLKIVLKYMEPNDLMILSSLWNYKQKNRVLNLIESKFQRSYFNYLSYGTEINEDILNKLNSKIEKLTFKLKNSGMIKLEPQKSNPINYDQYKEIYTIFFNDIILHYKSGTKKLVKSKLNQITDSSSKCNKTG